VACKTEVSVSFAKFTLLSLIFDEFLRCTLEKLRAADFSTMVSFLM
jgi:hypothetical protein